ncbi:DNA cytosine methyltransferase [Endozoicomonas sp. ONNA2]|uniref:DNA cytosine methyltransferase n=1 Tax=Endozoicomonas sp. ONNA2 TaxID=2828741 RepID=UPI0021490F8F|nr:DNA cytosine methyltransferase [Endozoicomonas sp. ONNA2]
MTFCLWENVPGAFSSNQGKDFAEVLRLLTGTEQSCAENWRYAGVSFGKEGLVEWRVCDAQFYGVPQRRRRVFALADFGDWTRREPILFESESLLRE